MKDTCRTCEHARQAGDKDQTDIVGCAALTRGDIEPIKFVGGELHQTVKNSNVYEGWIYSCRRPGDKRGYVPGLMLSALRGGSRLVDSDGYCDHYETASALFTDEGDPV